MGRTLRNCTALLVVISHERPAIKCLGHVKTRRKHHVNASSPLNFQNWLKLLTAFNIEIRKLFHRISNSLRSPRLEKLLSIHRIEIGDSSSNNAEGICVLAAKEVAHSSNKPPDKRVPQSRSAPIYEYAPYAIGPILAANISIYG